MSTAYSDMAREGVVGTSTVELLYATVAAVARIHRFPPPAGYERWAGDAVVETAHDFLAHRDGMRRIQQLYRTAFDDESFERLLHQAVRNHLRSQARATERGALLRRLRDVLSTDDRFATVAGDRGLPRWTLTATMIPEVYTGQIEHLVAVARGVEGLKVVRWRSTDRRGPVAERDSLARLCEEILRAAGTSMRIQQLADVVAARFNLGNPPLAEILDDDRLPPLPDTSQIAVGAQETAEFLWEQLTERERRLFPYLDEPVREVAEHIGLGKSQTAVAQTRVRQLLRDGLEGDPQPAEVIKRLDLLAREHADRTDA